ncbi:MAG: imidazole glycerol phosphate synthase subunit HisF, partial [Fusobacteriaceae bacterium]
MLAKRIIPCLDVKDGVVVKGVQFRNHEIVGNILELAKKYRDDGADELVFYDITASSDGKVVDKKWVEDIAKILDIPFCVAGGIKNSEQAKIILNNGADKISINSPALANPNLIDELVKIFGSQCVVIGIDSKFEDGDWYVYQFTGDELKTRATKIRTLDWIKEIQERGAGEIVLNCMNSDGVRDGYDLQQLKEVCKIISVPLIASGGAGNQEHFKKVFEETCVSGALAASVFHKNLMKISDLKKYLRENKIEVRI